MFIATKPGCFPKPKSIDDMYEYVVSSLQCGALKIV